MLHWIDLKSLGKENFSAKISSLKKNTVQGRSMPGRRIFKHIRFQNGVKNKYKRVLEILYPYKVTSDLFKKTSSSSP
jgi:hypothetical protein